MATYSNIFAWEIPLLYHLGVGHNSGCSHCSGLQVDDRALEIGKDFMSQLTLNILNR